MLLVELVRPFACMGGSGEGEGEGERWVRERDKWVRGGRGMGKGRGRWGQWHEGRKTLEGLRSNFKKFGKLQPNFLY